MRVLVTNDDGIDAPGLHALARAMVKDGHDVVVAAPLADMSGAGGGIGPVDLSRGLVLERDLPDLEGVAAFAVDGPPALAVVAARFGAFGAPPDVVVAGVNPGLNCGRAVLHSGTVGAAVTAANFGCPGIAVSLAPPEPWRFETAAAFGAAAVAWLAGAGAGSGWGSGAGEHTVLNLNVPNLAVDEVRGVRPARLAPFGTVRASLGEHVGGRRQLVLSDFAQPAGEDADVSLVAAGFVTVTSLVGIRATRHTDAADAIGREVLGGR